MSTVRASRKIERAGVNALRALLEDHEHIVQEIDGGNDHGEDMIVNFTRNGKRTPYWIAIQVKSGKKYKRVNGYAIPVEDHFDDWRQSRIPILGVVYDMKKRELFWVNLTERLKSTEESPGWVQIANTSLLNSETVEHFYTEVATYAGDARMRIRAATEEEALSEAVRARQGLDPSTAPNPLFEGLADIALKYEERITSISKDLVRSLPMMILVVLMLWAWPYQIRFVEGSSDMYPWLWVSNLYLFMFIMALVIFFEFRAGRVPMETGKWLWMIAANFFWLPVMDPDGDPGWWGTFWIWAGVLVPSFGLKLLFITFIRFAMDRIKKRREVEMV
ncbi:DUF4365 domain-containing protein [Streptomyces sp. NBC_01474]|uniref:DUF4365 domain-containing protein n=1 Tax=Streptomyces sp. NBC_01474 TaxID=2903880 RepID=UPI002DDC06E5|nr:DUF4365 domain-containing protein [Streptomyces sp. NBC_01474]WSD97364.1 DUF4365 domain-containing protein [Streptomyces sp. NBC_01474]